MSQRYEFPEDRFDFTRWGVTKGPCKKPYWWFNGELDLLIIELCKGQHCYRYGLTKRDMDLSRLGWRRLVARALREVRYALRKETK